MTRRSMNWSKAGPEPFAVGEDRVTCKIGVLHFEKPISD